MEKMITKFFRGEIKAIDKANHTVTVVMSDETVDGSDEIIDVTGWDLERFNKHPVLLSSHNYGDLRKQLGVAVRMFISEGKLMAEQKYFVGQGNEEADWAWVLAEKGVAAYSVGFMPTKVLYFGEMTEEEKSTTRARYKLRPEQTVRRIYLKQELLENSQVVIPCNPNALQESLKTEKDLVLVKALKDGAEVLKDIPVKAEPTPAPEVPAPAAPVETVPPAPVIENPVKVEPVPAPVDKLDLIITEVKELKAMVEGFTALVKGLQDKVNQPVKSGDEPNDATKGGSYLSEILKVTAALNETNAKISKPGKT